jgi:hypothetical protein
MSSFFAKPIVDNILRSIAAGVLFFSVRVGWDAIEALHHAGLPVWPVISNALPFAIFMGIFFPYSLRRFRQHRLNQQQ